MKNLTLIRHAKSSWEYDVIDHERPLNKRGINDAILISNYLKKLRPKVDALFCSDAIRTKATADFFISNLNISPEIVTYKHELYDFEGRSLLKEIRSCTNSVDHLMVFGHNYAITTFVNTFGTKSIENVPTCGLCELQFNINSWHELEQGQTIKTLFPKDLK